MRFFSLLLLLTTLLIPCFAEDDPDAPTNEKARKTYRHALDDLQHHMNLSALENLKKADKQDDGHCLACQKKMIKYGIEQHDWKAAETAGEEMIAEAQGDQTLAIAHYELGYALAAEGREKHKEEIFARAHQEITKALTIYANFPDAVFTDGQILALMKQDGSAKAQFELFAKMRPANDPMRRRALRYISDPDLARARMAPAFSVTTTDGQQVSLDDLQGKVVLLDFWATWCGPCREALPHMKDIARKFHDQPLLMLSISLDDDEQQWKNFIAKNEMTWPQYRDGGFGGPIAHIFAVHAIPQTFTIDADGVLQDQNVGDAAIEGKLKKLVARARDAEAAEPVKQ